MTYEEARRAHAAEALRQRQARRGDPLKVRLTTADSYARHDDPTDERLVAHDEPRFLPERRVWRDGMWQVEARAPRSAKPPRKPAPRRIEARGQDPDIVLRRAVTAVVRQDKGRPEEVAVIVGRKASVPLAWRYAVKVHGVEVARFRTRTDAHNAKSRMGWSRRLLIVEEVR